MNLTQIETNFFSSYKDLKSEVNQASSWDLTTNDSLKAKAVRFHTAMNQFVAVKATILKDLQSWKISSIKSAPLKNYDRLEINKKNKLIKTCIIVLDVVGGIFCGSGFAAMFGAHTLLRLNTITTVAAFGPIYGGMAIVVVGGIFLGISELMKNSKISREASVHNNENFKDFLQNVVKITPNETDEQTLNLSDITLHKIYERYKAAVIGLPHE